VAFLIRFTHTTTILPRILVKYSYVRPLATMVSSLPSLPSVLGTDPSSCILDAFRIAIAKRVSDALPPLTLEQAYTGVDYGKKGVDFTVALPRFRLPGKPDELAKKVITDVS
jgi:arginyl-tRNA synthetase